MTVLSLLALRSLGFTAYTYGLLLAVFGITSLIGASIAPWCGGRLGSGRVIILARAAYPIVWLLVALAPSTPVGDVLLFVALPLQGLAAPTLIAAVIAFAAAALTAALSPLRQAPGQNSIEVETSPPSPEDVYPA